MSLLPGLLSALLLTGRCWGYGGGAPLSSCSSLTPGHGPAPRPASTSPFSLQVEAAAGSTVSLQLLSDGSARFKGFLVQARRVTDNTTVGSFSLTEPAAPDQQVEFTTRGKHLYCGAAGPLPGLRRRGPVRTHPPAGQAQVFPRCSLVPASQLHRPGRLYILHYGCFTVLCRSDWWPHSCRTSQTSGSMSNRM